MSNETNNPTGSIPKSPMPAASSSMPSMPTLGSGAANPLGGPSTTATAKTAAMLP